MLFQTLPPQMSNIHDTAPCFGFTEQEIEEIQIDKPTERSRKLSLLLKWRSRKGSDATYLAIVDVFLRMKDRNLAEIVLRYVKSAAEKEQIKKNQNQHIQKKNDNHHLADDIARLHSSKCNYMSHYKYSPDIVKFVVF